MGGTMRCGQRKTIFKDQKIMYKLYGSKAEVSERHRHRYEVNPEHVKEISSKGLNRSLFSSVKGPFIVITGGKMTF